MIDTLFFLLQIIGFLVLVGWAVIYDRIPADGAVAGPLAFKRSSADTTDPARERRPRAGLTRHQSDANLKDRRR